MRSLFLWQRYLGLAAAVFVATLTLSGILINYSDGFQFSKRYILSERLLNWYGIAMPAIAVSYPAGPHWITQVGERIHFDFQEIEDLTGRLHGATQLADKVAIAAGDQVLLLTPRGELIDRLGGAEGMPDAMQVIGTAQGKVVLHAFHGAYQADEQFLAWRPKPNNAPGVRWAAAAPPPYTLRRMLVQQYRGTGVTWERLLLDLHSGRLFGAPGMAIMNIAAVFMLLLAISAVWHFFQRKRRWPTRKKRKFLGASCQGSEFNDSGAPLSLTIPGSVFQQFKIGFAGAAIRATPSVRHVIPTGPGRYAILRAT